jgi:hypothetical protein
VAFRKISSASKSLESIISPSIVREGTDHIFIKS